METTSPTDQNSSGPNRQEQARQYERIHNWLFVVDLVLTLVLLLVFLGSGLSQRLAYRCEVISPNPWMIVTLYVVAVVVAQTILLIPLSYYSGFYLEHKFGLSNETITGWVQDKLKSLGLNLVLGVFIVNVIYFLLRRSPQHWWVWTGVFLFLFGVLMTNLFPVLILPLFYKLKPLDDVALTERLTRMAESVGAKVLGVYRMEMSEKTKKANAAMAGLGNTKRIILGDTLLSNYTPEEIEVVLAHELAHYKYKDLWRMLALGAVTTFVGLWIADLGLRACLPLLGFKEVSDIAAFPLIILVFVVYGMITMPVSNGFSRWREYIADAFAVQLTRNVDAFVSAMNKLAEQNLADLSPSPVIEWLLHDHPALSKRIAAAEKMR
ncbi:MAG: M48 family peptidase [Verrucomicrobiae bacterium]|nr:M48 family peptidase [Verrucomicrobiae bacterium]